jgi:hypothetical protein
MQLCAKLKVLNPIGFSNTGVKGEELQYALGVKQTICYINTPK